MPTGIKDVDYQLAASRTYNNIQITYFFMRNNSVIIKSSYRANYQIHNISCGDAELTSYALTEQYMTLSCNNQMGTLLLIYEMEELYPRLIDKKRFEKDNITVISTSNYLEKGF